MLFFRSYFFKGSETDLNKLVQKQLALNSTITILEKLQPNKCKVHNNLTRSFNIQYHIQIIYKKTKKIVKNQIITNIKIEMYQYKHNKTIEQKQEHERCRFIINNTFTNIYR